MCIKYLHAVKYVYDAAIFSVRTIGTKTSTFHIAIGLHLGSTDISPDLQDLSWTMSDTDTPGHVLDKAGKCPKFFVLIFDTG